MAATRSAVLLLVVAIAGASALLPRSDPWHAVAPIEACVRLCAAFALVLWLPGALLRQLLGHRSGCTRDLGHPVENLLASVALGYASLTLLCVLTTLLHLPIGFAAAADFALVGSLALRTSGRVSFESLRDGYRRLSPLAWCAVALGALITISAWILESPIRGEETVELITARKLLENPEVTLTGVMHRTGAIPTYIFAPYSFFVALLAKVSGIHLIAVYSKLRFFLAPLAIAAFWALVRRITGDKALATLAVIATEAIVMLNPTPWMWPASLFPLARRGAFSAGVLVPILMWLLMVTLDEDRVAKNAAAKGSWVVSSTIVSLVVLSVLMTHALELVAFGFFLAAVLVTSLLRQKSKEARRGAVLLVAALAISCAGYKAIHAQVVTHVAGFERESKELVRSELMQLLSDPGSVVVGPPSSDSRDLVSTVGTWVPYSLIGVFVLPLILISGDWAGRLIWLILVPALVGFTHPALYRVLALSTTPEIKNSWYYFALFGLVAFLFAAWSAVRLRRLRIATVVISGLLAVPIARMLVAKAMAYPEILSAYGILSAVAALASFGGGSRWGLKPAGASPTGREAASFFLLISPLVLALAVVFPVRPHGTHRPPPPQPLLTLVAREFSIPSALDLANSYDRIRQSTAPTLDMPQSVLRHLSRIVEPGQVLVYAPEHSYAIPVFWNTYIANIGHVLSTDLRYFAKYAPIEANSGSRIHPIFNRMHLSLDPTDLEFLDENRVKYIVLNPEWRDVVSRKLARAPERFALIYDQGGFSVFAVKDGLKTSP